MIFHESRLLADDSSEISYLIFFWKFVKMLQNLPSAAVVIGALRVNYLFVWFDSLRSINNLSVKQGRVFLGWTSTKLG